MRPPSLRLEKERTQRSPSQLLPLPLLLLCLLLCRVPGSPLLLLLLLLLLYCVPGYPLMLLLLLLLLRCMCLPCCALARARREARDSGQGCASGQQPAAAPSFLPGRGDRRAHQGYPSLGQHGWARRGATQRSR